jgi:phosphatidate phosphatase APP1
VSVISDIDDTIKISEVRNREALLRNTFLGPFRPVPGMAEIYAAWATNHGASFHYVTACPWQLQPELATFLRTNGFPEGTFQMKQFRWKDQSFFGLFQSPERHKRNVIERWLRQFPQRQFILVGDSGERDPEVYGELARRFPGQVRRILIRDVTAESGEADRYRRAFAEVPAGVAVVFGEAEAIRAAIGATRLP